MTDIKEYFVGVKFPSTEKSYYFSTTFEDLNIGDFVVVETISGVEMGTVSVEKKPISEYSSDLLLKPILRKPTITDLNNFRENIEDAKDAMNIAQAESDGLGLGMNIIDAYYTLDGSKITITYTADGRVDFRELLHILASALRCRIELKQIAPRDKAKMIGGIGICGLPLCCSTFLHEFEGISLSRAKNQMLMLNIPKLSGACGKLICCLLFEDDMYTEAKKEFPSIGQIVHTDEGDFFVESYNVISKMVRLVNSTHDNYKSLTLEDCKAMIAGTYKKPVVEEKDPFPSITTIGGKENSYNGQNNNRQNNDNRNNRENRNNNNNHGNNNRFHGNHHHHGHNNNRPNRPNNNDKAGK